MFNLKRIKELEERIDDLEMGQMLNHEAIDLLADEMGAEIDECDCCGDLTLNFD
jgi:hypothetical protein